MTLVINRGFTFADPPSKPTPIVPPTWHCVVDIGIPRKEAMITTVPADNSMQNPLEGDCCNVRMLYRRIHSILSVKLTILVILYPSEIISL